MTGAHPFSPVVHAVVQISVMELQDTSNDHVGALSTKVLCRYQDGPKLPTAQYTLPTLVNARQFWPKHKRIGPSSFTVIHGLYT